jgi:hypothetical protein
MTDWRKTLLDLAMALPGVALAAQQMRPVQPYPVQRTAEHGTTPPPAQIFKVFQFTADKIPRIDGDASDWAMVPESYSIGLDQMHDDEHKHATPDPTDLDVHVKVGWVKGLNRLYFLHEAYDNFWDFSDPGLHNDTFEIIVDGDRSGGPLVPQFRNNPDQDEWDAHFSMHGVQAQNYHVFTPSEGKDWHLPGDANPGSKSCPMRTTRKATTLNMGRVESMCWSST